jgi:hypothetical protein
MLSICGQRDAQYGEGHVSHLADFHEIFYVNSIFRKSVEKKSKFD